MSSGTHRKDTEKEDLQHHKERTEDERGWAGQQGQRPANEQEKNYRPSDHHKPGPKSQPS